MLHSALIIVFLAGSQSFALKSSSQRGFSARSTFILGDNNSNMFGGAFTTVEDYSNVSDPDVVSPIPNAPGITTRQQRAIDAASKLRKEAEEAELALRDEAREKGIPEDMINKLMPVRDAPGMSKDQRKIAIMKGEEVPPEATYETPATKKAEKVVVNPKFASEVRVKLGYLNTGDAVRMTSELDRLKKKEVVQLWASADLERPNFSVNNYQFTDKTKIEPAKLKLDDVGFDYQKTFLYALGFASVFGIGSSLIPEDYGQLGFLMGYVSALFPILIVGVGSIAPGLIGTILNEFKFKTDSAEKQKWVNSNAGKFLVGYVMGLPVASFSTGGSSNTCDFFQIRPGGVKADAMLGNKFKQSDIARSSAVCMAGPVAQCWKSDDGAASVAMPGDVNTLYELMNAVEPALSPNQVQDHIRWSGLTAYKILEEHSEAYERLCVAFDEGLPIEECIACIEGTTR